jgi:TonB-linked SusC/RagA family outer membrane protein
MLYSLTINKIKHMKKILLTFLLLCIVTLTSVYAQSRRITGKVIGADDGQPLAGVSVSISGSSQGTQTNVDGNFSLNVPAGATSLKLSYLGYKSTVVSITSSSIYNVKLSAESSTLSEVVVTSYGTVQTKREIGGAISTINAKDFANQPIPSLQSALQGRAAGVVVTANNGIPGGAINVTIRGIGSFSGSTQPLYVVDGVQLAGETFTQFTQGNTLAGINTNDIESIEVLKDAASTAIYGSSGANGVVLITTKKGRAGKTVINFNYYTGQVRPIKTFHVLNTQQYIQLRTEAFQNQSPTASATAIRNAVLGEIGQPTTLTDADIAALPSYDFQKAGFHNATVNSYEMSASGGDSKNNFLISAGYDKQGAVITKSDFERYTFRVKLDHKENEKLSFNTNIGLSTFNQTAPFTISGSFLGSPAFSSSLILPSNAIYNPDGTYYGLPGSGQNVFGVLNQNVVAINDYDKSTQRTTSLIGSFAVNYNFLPSLSFNSFYSTEYRIVGATNFTDPRTNDAFAVQGRSEAFNDTRTNLLTDQILSYNKAFNENNKLTALLGFEYNINLRHSLDEQSTGIAPGFTEVGAGSTPVFTAENATGYKKLAYFGKLNYIYKQKLALSASLRYQGSSRFGINNQFGWFPGASAAYTISQEGFLKNVTWINDLKIRASAGSAGNDNPINDFDARALFSTAGIVYNGSPGQAPTSVANPNLKWERSTSYDLGLDFSLFNNRISGSAGVYLRKSTDLLLQEPVSSVSGFGFVTANVGAMDNKGIEFELHTVNIVTRDGFKWTSNFNYSTNINRVRKLYNGLSFLPSSNNVRVGYDFSSIYTFKYAGVNPATGRPFWYDAAGNTTYAPSTSTDRYYIGSQAPRFTGGFTNSFSYKGFDLNVLLQYQYGQKILDAQLQFLYEDGRRSFNTLSDIYNRRWTTPGQITDIPRPYNGGSESQGIAGTSTSSFTYFKSDYIRLKEVQFGYSVPKTLLARAHITSLRVYLQGTNLATYTKYPGYDPENFDTTGRNNAGTIPTSKNLTFGVQLGL